MKFTLAVMAALAAVALCAAGVAGAARQTPGTTFHLVEKDEAFNFVDNKPTSNKHAASIGDLFAFTSSLWTPAHKRAGSLQASCVVTSGGVHPTYECSGTFTLAGGQLELQTSMRDGVNPTNIAIVGGTGAYEGALGSVKAVSRSENSPYTYDTVHLLPKAA